jgi:hypothetical protein
MDIVLAHWKEISIVLSGTFAVLGLVWDAKDKATGRITIWGRVFLILTVLSIACSVIAQLKDNQEAEERSERNQRDMLAILGRTEKTIHELSRIMQPIERPIVSLFLEIDCESQRFKNFCKIKLERIGERLRKDPIDIDDLGASLDLTWEHFPEGESTAIPLHAYFFKDRKRAEEFIQQACFLCYGTGDLDLDLSPDNYSKMKSLSLMFFKNEKTFQLASLNKVIDPEINSNEIMSITDISRSTVVLAESNGYLTDLRPTWLHLKTPRGQKITITSFTAKTVAGQRVFLASVVENGEVKER